MNNFINFRIKGVNNIKLKGSLEHNFRSKNSRNDKNDNDNIFYPINQDQGIELPNGFDKGLNKAIAGNFYDEYLEDRKEHNTFYKNRRKQNLKDMQGSWFEGVVTFSEQLKYDLGDKYTNNELKMATKAALDEIMEYMGSELKYVVLHLNETTPHFHFHAKNYDKDGRSLTHKFNSTKDLSLFQDIMYKHLKSLGLERGISKSVTGKKFHKDTIQHYEQLLKDKDNTLKNAINELNKVKNDFKEIKLKLDRKSQEFDLLDKKHKQLQKMEKEARADYREFKKFAAEVSENADNNIVQLNKKIENILNEHNGYFGFNIEKAKEQLSEILEIVPLIKTKNKSQEQELNNLKKYVQKLEDLNKDNIDIAEEFDNLKITNKNLEQNLKIKNSTIKNLEQKNKNLDLENDKLRNKIYELEQPKQEQEKSFHRHR